MEQQRLSGEIGIQMHVCKSNNPNDKFTANDMTCSIKTFDHNGICSFMKNIRRTAAYWADILGNLFV